MKALEFPLCNDFFCVTKLDSTRDNTSHGRKGGFVTKRKFTEKETPCQKFLKKFRQVRPKSCSVCVFDSLRAQESAFKLPNQSAF